MQWFPPSSRILPVLRRRKGMALVLVLSFLVLLSALILAFFGSVTTETKASRFADNGTRGRELAETATNIVMAQIREATTRGSNIAWASQPGMIRTYGVANGASSGASSAPLAYYKLYSAERMSWTPADGAFSPATDVPANWHTLPALYTDLNLPVKNLAGARIYPIMDPTAATIAPVTQGFAITSPPVKGTGAEDNPAPMPVKWLYVLQDGTLTSPSGSTSSDVTWAPGTSKSPSKTNPIVGRVAFWTDDESSKVNINTAAGDEWALAATEPGSFWDVPYLFTDFEKNKLALRQPAQLEYQRYPGHPATTYLSAVIPSLTRQQIGLIAPRMELGGSKGGTVWAPDKVLLDTDRLYASVDELIYNPDRSTQAGMDKTVLKPLLERSRFFLTAHSRAPEVTLFNTPRVSIWPIHALTNTAAEKYRSPFDELIAFCSQYRMAGATKEYFFKRNDPLSVTADLVNIPRNQELYTYLQNMTSREIPGFGGKFDQKYPLDRDQILTEIFDYIRSTNLFDDSIEPQPLPWSYPTKGKQFTKGRAGESSGVAGHGQAAPIHRPDPSDPTDATKSTMGFGRFDTLSEIGLHFICTADGSGNPAGTDTENMMKIESNKLQNRTLVSPLGSTEKRVEVALLMELFSAAHGWTALCRHIQIEVIGLDGLALKGSADTAATPLGFPAKARMYITQNSAGTIHGRGWGGLGGFRTHMRGRSIPARGNVPADAANLDMGSSYPFVSAPVTIKPGGSGTMVLESNGPVTINIYAGGAAKTNSTELVQTIKVNFTGHTPVTTFPAPKLCTTGAPKVDGMHGTHTETDAKHWWSYSKSGAFAGGTGRIRYVGDEPGTNNGNGGGGYVAGGTPIRAEDTLRTLIPFHGDYRLVAASREVPVNVFLPHQHYNDNTKRLAHSMTEVLGSNYIFGATMQGKLVKGASYPGSRRPDVPFRADADGGPWSSDSGDFDNGLGPVPDGAYINKPDEGSAYDGVAGAIPYFSYTERHETAGPTFFSPNRQVMSPVMFGSLPSQVKANVPWRTLLFRPNTGVAAHVGAQSPKDHLLLDLFWMPVVEPYAISEPFSTAGKINMNYQIMPFTYIERSTGLRALLRSERVAAVPVANANNYKTGTATNFRLEIDAAQTLEQFKTRFAANDIFRAPSELCDLYLVPQGAALANMATYWNTTNTLTGDNMKERPYAKLYPRLTTKSNTYTVHYRVQALRQAVRSRGDSPDAWAKWNETNDMVVSETRGSTVLERYIDPEDSRLQDYATKSASAADYAPLDTLYRFRVIHSKRFLP